MPQSDGGGSQLFQFDYEDDEDLIKSEREDEMDIGSPTMVSSSGLPIIQQTTNQALPQPVPPPATTMPRLSVRPLNQLTGPSPFIPPTSSSTSRDPRLNKAPNVFNSAAGLSPVIEPVARIKTEPTVDHRPPLPVEVLSVRSVTGNLEQIMNSLEDEPVLRFTSIPGIRSSHTTTLDAELLNQSPLVRSSHNPVFIQQATAKNVANAVTMHPHRNISPAVREIAHKVGFNLTKRTKEEPVDHDESPPPRPSSKSNQSSSVQTETAAASNKVDQSVQTSENTLNYFITDEHLKKLSDFDRSQFHELLKRMGLGSKTGISDLLERNTHRKVKGDDASQQKTSGVRRAPDERESYQNPPAPPMAPPKAPVIPRRNNYQPSTSRYERFEPYRR